MDKTILGEAKILPIREAVNTVTITVTGYSDDTFGVSSVLNYDSDTIYGIGGLDNLDGAVDIVADRLRKAFNV